MGHTSAPLLSLDLIGPEILPDCCETTALYGII